MPIPDLPTLQSLAREAGAILRDAFNPRPGFNPSLHVEHKGVIDLVTDVDHRAESYLIEQIHARFPGHAIVAEESGGHEGSDAHRWFIDPLDGTVNFVHGVPFFSVSLAYAHQGNLALGAVYDPIRDECFTAQRGRGAWLNGDPIKVSQVSDLNDSLLVTGFPYDVRTNPENNLDLFAKFSLRTQGVRRLGSAALDLSYVAAGRLDGFWEMRLNAHDVAAGGLIAQEAGARVTSMQGDSNFLSPPQSILAANPALHEVMLQILQG
jgi:myo-inositol-1(or 4)-monophosphatase